MKKIIFLTSIALLFTILLFSNITNAKLKSYYSGQAINYEGKVYITSTNTGDIEIFSLDLNKKTLSRITRIAKKQGRWNKFYDSLFDIENGHLYLYATTGRYLYKYEASRPERLILLNKVKDNSWDWFGSLDKADGHLITKGTKFTKIWNSNLEVINAYKITNKTNPYNIHFGYAHNWIYNINNNKLEIFSRSQRKVENEINLEYKQNGNHKLHADLYNKMIYVVDDEGLKKFNLFGSFYKLLKNNQNALGYDVIYSTNGKDIYYSNGLGVKKVNKDNFNIVSTFDNSSFNYANSWAMGLERVYSSQGELIVVFNNSNILVLDHNLQPIASLKSKEKTMISTGIGSLGLKLDKNEAKFNELITVSGQGFGAEEKIKVSLDTRYIYSKTDENGKFSALIRVPEMKFNNTDSMLKDIIVQGEQTGLHYNISVRIDK